VIVLQQADLRLWSSAEVEAGTIPSDAKAALHTILKWSAAFLNTEHPDLGRDGPVCPFTKTAMDKVLYFLTLIPAEKSMSEIGAIVDRYTDWYRTLAGGINDRDRTFLAMLIVLPGIETGDSSSLDRLQQSLKDRCVRDGLMIGQFHPACDQPGLWNEDFRPLRSPIPLLAIRTMVQYDLPFLLGSGAHLEAYLSRFAPAIPAHLRRQLTRALTRAEMSNVPA
jgi:hypothetical protein